MAIKRETIKVWKGVKFQTFPLKCLKKTNNSLIWVFGGRYFSLFGRWEGVEYTGRYRFHTPLPPDENREQFVVSGLWDMRKMREWVLITNAKGERTQIQRGYFCLEPSEAARPNWYATFIGGYYKSTLRGIGQDRDYEQYVELKDGQQVEVLAVTQNTCRSGRYGNYASFVISGELMEIKEKGVA